MSLLDEIFNKVLEGDINNSEELIRNAVKKGINPEDIIEKSFNKALLEVGYKFEKQEYFLPEMLASAMAVKKGM